MGQYPFVRICILARISVLAHKVAIVNGIVIDIHQRLNIFSDSTFSQAALPSSSYPSMLVSIRLPAQFGPMAFKFTPGDDLENFN